MNNQNKKIVYRRVDEPLTPKELSDFERDGWKLVSQEPNLYFVPGEPETQSGTRIKYVFRKS